MRESEWIKIGIDTSAVNSTPTAHHLFSCTILAQSRCSLVVIVFSHTLTHAPARLKSRSTLPALPHLMTPRTGTPSSPFEQVFQRAERPCEDRRPQLSGAMAEPQLFTGYEHQQLAEDRHYKHFTGDGQFTEHEDLRVKPLSFYQSIIASTCDSAESIATLPLESDLHDQQLRALAGFSIVPTGARSKCRTIANSSL